MTNSEAIEVLKKNYPDCCYESLRDAVDTAIYALSAQPERKKGKWNCSDDMYESGICSVCKWDTGEPYYNCKKWFQFCPNCGAEMGGEE